MSSNYMLINRYQVATGSELAIKSIVKRKSQTLQNSYYISDEQDELIEFTGFHSLKDFADHEATLNNAYSELEDHLCRDIQHELFSYIESPVASETTVPLTQYVQLRHIEVLPSAYRAYLKWREETIFNVVRNNSSTIVSFDAYHSLVSNVPSIMFISSFSCDLLKPTTDDHDKNIITQVDDNYTVNNKEGIYTKIYEKLEGYCNFVNSLE